MDAKSRKELHQQLEILCDEVAGGEIEGICWIVKRASNEVNFALHACDLAILATTTQLQHIMREGLFAKQKKDN